MNRNFSFKGFQVFLIILISILIGYYIGINKIQIEWRNFKPVATVQSKTPPASLPLDMSLFFKVLDRINRDYYDKEKIDTQKVLYGAISGMLQSLQDPYTSFFPPLENSSFKTQLAGQFEGIGAELGISQDNRITVVSPLDGSPAQKAGVRSGDTILQVDGKDTAGWTLPQAVEKIRGQKGTEVVLTILHENAKSQANVKITRDVIVVKSVTGWLRKVDCIGDNCKIIEDCSSCSSIAYIRLSQFGDKTNDEWSVLVNELSNKINNEKKFRGVVLDLRNNPGGYLSDAVFIASEFLKNGVVVIQEDNSQARKEMSVVRKGILLSYPLIVLVNKGSASASEIVAGALRDHGRAMLVGEKSFGKGTIQEAVEVGNGASVHISVAKWLTPKGIWVNKNGLEPDIKVDYDATDTAKLADNTLDNQLEKAIEELVK